MDYVLLAFKSGELGEIDICGPKLKDLPPSLRIKKANLFGSIDVNSDTYKHLIQRNRFSILLSRSEGLPISIVTTMQSGLIPIISDYCGSNFGDLAVVIKDNELQMEILIEKLKYLRNLPLSDLNDWSNRCKEYAKKRFNMINCKNNITDAIKELYK